VPGDSLSPVVLDKLELEHAFRAIVLSSDEHGFTNPIDRDNRTLMETLAIVSRNPDIPITAELRVEESLQQAKVLSHVEFMVSRHYGERLASQAALNPGVMEIYNSLMTFKKDSNAFFTIPVPIKLIGRTFKDAKLYFLNMDTESVVLVGLDRSPVNQPHSSFSLNPMSSKSMLTKPELTLRPGDKLVLIAHEQPSFIKVDREDLWDGKILSMD